MTDLCSKAPMAALPVANTSGKRPQVLLEPEGLASSQEIGKMSAREVQIGGEMKRTVDGHY